MRTQFAFLLLFFCTSTLISQVTKTVGVSDSTSNFPTIAAAFAAINSGIITDGNGNPADSVTLVLIDPVYNESELTLAPTTGYPQVVIMDGDVINPTINITQVLGTGVGFRIDSLESFVHACVNISMDTAFTWISAMEIYLAKEWIKPCPSHVMSIYAPTATTGIRVVADSGGTFTMKNCIVKSKVCLTFDDGPFDVSQDIVLQNNTFQNSDTSIFLGGINARNIEITGNTFDNVGSAIITDSIGADSITIRGNTATFGFQNAQLEVQQKQGSRQQVPAGNAVTQGKDRFSHFKDHRGQGHDNIIVISNNIITAIDSADAGISLDGISGGNVRVDSNTIDMGGSGTAIIDRKQWNWISLDGIAFFTAKSNTTSNGLSGIVIELDSDTTGLGGVDPDSLTFGSFDIVGNVMSNVRIGHHWDYKKEGSDWPEKIGVKRIHIANNELNGDGSPGSTGIMIDTLAIDSLSIESNQISVFQTGVKYIVRSISFHSPSEHTSSRLLSGNTITACGDGAVLTVDQDLYDDTSQVLVEENIFSGNTGNALEIIVDGDSGLVILTVASNTFSNNGESGVVVLSIHPDTRFKDHRGQGHDNIMMPKALPGNVNRHMLAAADPPNSFSNNAGNGLVLDGTVIVPDGIHYQNFSNNGGYNLFNGTTQPIDADSNWWGTSDSATIASTIFDGDDSSGLGSVNFFPFLIDSVTAAIASIDVSLSAGWNLVSVPVGLFDYSTAVVFPNAISQTFAYNGVYSMETILNNRVGYWVKFGSSEISTMIGMTINNDTIDVLQGWNLIGSISSAVAVTQIGSVPGGIITSQLFQYNNGYQTADSIRPGKGYWIKVSEAGKLVLATAPGAATATIHIVPTDELPPTAPESESQNSKPETPDNFALEQNYPNPFNPSTVIRYQVPVNSHVTLKVYNTLGQEVISLLLEERMDAGNYEMNFNAVNLPSGIYMYRITAIPITISNNGQEGFSSIKRMVLLK